MEQCWLDTIQGLIPSGWHYIMSGLTDLLSATDDPQSFALAIFVVGLLSFTVVCLVFGLLHNGVRVPATRGVGEKQGGARRRCGGHAARGDEAVYGPLATGASVGHTSTKRWITVSITPMLFSDSYRSSVTNK